MDKFKAWLLRFMQGRYGADETFYALTAVYIIMTVVNMFVQSWVLHIIGLVIFAIAVLRTLSRNISARRRENEPMRKLFGRLMRKAPQANRDTVNFAYKKCPGCGKTLRLPRAKGKHNTRCPNCGKEFAVRIR